MGKNLQKEVYRKIDRWQATCLERLESSAQADMLVN
jgi:hypothetical protein